MVDSPHKTAPTPHRTCKWCAAPLADDSTRCSACNRSYTPSSEEIRPFQRVGRSLPDAIVDTPATQASRGIRARRFVSSAVFLGTIFGLAWAAGFATSKQDHSAPDTAATGLVIEPTPVILQPSNPEAKKNIVLRKRSAETLEFGSTAVTFTKVKMLIHGANSDISIIRRDRSDTSLLYAISDPTAPITPLHRPGTDNTSLQSLPIQGTPDLTLFTPFPFFDASPSTVGIVVYPADSEDSLTTADMLLFDLSSNRFARVPIGPSGKPLWIDTSCYPPTLGIGIPVFLGSGSAGSLNATRVQRVLRFQNNAFVADEGLTQSYLGQHYNDADLSLSERAELQGTPLIKLPPALNNKLTERLFYGSLLGKHDELHTLLISLERTTQEEGEILVNAFASPAAADRIPPDPSGSEDTPPPPVPTLPNTDHEVLAAARLAVEAANRGNYRKALELWTELSEKGDAPSQYNLGRLYARGNGVRQDFGKARYWFEKSAFQGYSEAQLKLGMLYYYGDGVTTDRDLARTLFQKAALQGNREAMDFLKKLERDHH